MDQIKKNNIAYAKLLNKCWDDPAYLEKFRADPAAALTEHGIPTPPNARYHIVAPADLKPSTNEDVYLFYIPKPDITSVSDKTLSEVAGGDQNVGIVQFDPVPTTTWAVTDFSTVAEAMICGTGDEISIVTMPYTQTNVIMVENITLEAVVTAVIAG